MQDHISNNSKRIPSVPDVTDQKTERTIAGLHTAIIIGGSIAGLTAARVLAPYVKTLTILDRDHLDGRINYRHGTPQALHAHTLLDQGQRILDELFPGIIQELIAAGAVSFHSGQEKPFFRGTNWRFPKIQSHHPSISASRPFLESAVYNRVRDLPNVSFLPDVEVIGLEMHQTKNKVLGVQVRDRSGGSPPSQSILYADLVIDASGRNSQAPHWLEKLDLQPPEEWIIDSSVGYATQIYQKPEDLQADWKALYIPPEAPDRKRGGVILPLEDQRWTVTLMGIGQDYPPIDEQGFLEFARSLPTKKLYQAIQTAQPISEIRGFRRNTNRVRRYDQLPVYLEGFLVLGDAVFAMNPIYAQGMTAAALSSKLLAKILKHWEREPSLEGLASKFQEIIAAEIGRIWKTTVRKEWEWSEVKLSDNTEKLYPRGIQLPAAA